MYKRLLFLSMLPTYLISAGSAQAGLIVHWPFDDGASTTATHIIGGGGSGTLTGNSSWDVGMAGGSPDCSRRNWLTDAIDGSSIYAETGSVSKGHRLRSLMHDGLMSRWCPAPEITRLHTDGATTLANISETA
ncbi:MAG: hypothetical protein JW741_05360 [Sedimentisphaerales bacterium]|nr:hypothetical protein [Sedimentisphaerales bacterium]